MQVTTLLRNLSLRCSFETLGADVMTPASAGDDEVENARTILKGHHPADFREHTAS
jgi:hypothetical protein